MKRRLTHPHWLLASAAGFAVAGGVLSATDEAAAQQGMMQVLIPDLAHERDAPRNFGRNVARELRNLIDELPGLRVLEGRALNDALRPFDLREADLDCPTARQFALQAGLDVLMCGEVGQVDGGVEVKARFILVDSGETLPLEPFVQPDERRREQAAAQRIVNEFDNYNQMVRSARICADYAESGDFDAALRNCDEALAVNANFPSALYGKGRALMELGQPEAALETFEHLLSVDEQHEDGLLAAGLVATRLNRDAVARGYLDSYLELNPGNVDVRIQIALDVVDEGDPHGALHIAEQGLEETPNDLRLRQYSGHFAIMAAEQLMREQATGVQQADLTPEARTLYETAIEHYAAVFEDSGAETDPDVLQRMILALTRLERYDEAIELGERAVAAVDDEAALWYTYADALYRSGRVDDALAALDRTEQLDPEYQGLHGRRGTWLLEIGRLDDARTAFRTAIEQGTPTDALANNIFIFGHRHYQNDDYETALDYFALSREFGTDPLIDARTAFFAGVSIYELAMRVEAPQTAESAAAALPMFQQALELFGESGPFGEQNPGSNLERFIQNARDYIEIQEVILDRRGR